MHDLGKIKVEHPDSTTQTSRKYRAETGPDNKRNNPGPSGPWPLIDYRQGKMERVYSYVYNTR